MLAVVAVTRCLGPGGGGSDWSVRPWWLLWGLLVVMKTLVQECVVLGGGVVIGYCDVQALAELEDEVGGLEDGRRLLVTRPSAYLSGANYAVYRC